MIRKIKTQTAQTRNLQETNPRTPRNRLIIRLESHTMKFHLCLIVLQVAVAGAFLMPLQQRLRTHLSATQESPGSEVERLLAKAAALRAEAEQAEHQVHSKETEKKKAHEEEVDKRIDFLFFDANNDVVAQLHKKRLSFDTLKEIVTRLHDREIKASGKEHVNLDVHQDRVDVNRVSGQVDEAELQKLDGLVEKLIEAVSVLDKELKSSKEKSGNVFVNHIEDEHFGGLDSSKRLEQYYHEIHRAHEEQFLKRQEEFVDAQTIKKDNKPPPKQKDHMMHP